MKFTSWIECVGRSLKLGSCRKAGRRDCAVQASEQLEDRSLMSASALFIAGELNVSLGPTDDVVISDNPVSAGNVLVLLNGRPVTNITTVASSSVTKIIVNGGDDANLIDLTGVTGAAFSNPALSIVVNAGNGSDTLLGSTDLADSLDGGDGDDSIDGNGGNDTLLGSDGDDSISGGAGADSINAGDGQDTIDGNGGADTIFAGNGQDLVDGSGGNDNISGDDGTDTLLGGDGNDTLSGNAGTDSIDGQNGDDSILGGTGDDTLLGGSGADVVDGQAGNDLEYAEAVGGQAAVSTALISSTVFATNFDGGLPTQLSGTTTVTGVLRYAGLGTGTNVFGGNLLENATGGTVAAPGSIPQTATTLTLANLPTHTSIDINFLLAIINSWNGLNAAANFGMDFFNVRVDGTRLFRGAFDNITATGVDQGYLPPAGVQLTPRPFMDLGFPSPSATLDSAWNLGLDPLFNNVPHSANTLTIDFFADGPGFEGGTDESWGIDNLEVILNGVPTVTTLVSNDTLLGSAGNDTLNGADGNDLLNGGGGADLLDGGNGNDSILGGAGHDVIIGGNGDDVGRGQAGNDTMTGTAGADLMDGGAGLDVISSGTVATTFLVSIGNASTIEGTGGSNSVSLTVTLSSAAPTPITVDFATTPGSATAGSDFGISSGTLTFAPGTTTQIINIPIITDSTNEFVESFTVDLSNAVGAIINDSIGFVTITDDDGPSSVVSNSTALSIASAFLESNPSQFGLTNADVHHYDVTKSLTTKHNGVTSVYLQQNYQGLPIIDATITINVMPDGSILSAYSSFVSDVAGLNLSKTPGIVADVAYAGLGLELAEHLANDPHGHGGTFVGDGADLGDDTLPGSSDQNSMSPGSGYAEETQEITPLRVQRNADMADRLQWAKTPDGELALVWSINVMTMDEIGWYDSSVDAATGELLNNVSWISHASYNVINYNEEAPLYAPRTIEVNPQNSTASPFGWHDTNGTAGAEFTDTRGNNVFAQGARDDDPLFDLLFGGNLGSGPRPSGGANLDFNSPFNDTQAPSTYLDAATANLFYTNNILHDIHYQYGFDEASGNFQVNNYGNGGVGNDAVNANAQAGANLPPGPFTRNNAFMATPPDGFSPIMAMFEWNINFSTFRPINPARDSDFENGIIIHEFGHGVSNRLTDRSGNADGLQAIQSGGMGEGWSDWWALMFTQQASDVAGDARPIGNYVQDQLASGPGIRRFPYSFDLAVSPLTFTAFNADPTREVHNTGELWSQALWDMNWLLINGINTPDCDGNTTPGYGFDPDLYNGTGGNNLALQLVMDGLKLQPANPSFTQSRDAILQADIANNGGANSRAIWTAFARRGLGFSADAGPDGNTVNITTAFDLPPELGSVRLDDQVYDVGDLVTISVCDTDVAGNANSVTVLVTTFSGDSENVVLNRQPDQTFSGTILTQRAAIALNNGLLDISTESDLLTVTYIDPNNGAGQAVTLQALAVINAGDGDTLIGGDGGDIITGGAGDDVISADAGNDIVFGGDGNDSILGGVGDDLLDGQAGDDTIRGQGGKDTVIGGEGNDVFEWNATSDGDDIVSSTSGDDRMSVTTGGASDVVAVGKLGSKLRITSGANELIINPTIRLVTIDTGAGDDTVTIGNVSGITATVLTINGGLGNDTLDGSLGVLGNVRLGLNGNEGNDSIIGTTNDDTIDGGAGLDTLFGGSGNDTMFGGADVDVINGQAGNDSLLGNDGNDVLSGGLGNDVVRGGLGQDVLSGNDGADTLAGDDGRDTLSGGIGNDSLEGGLGKDTLLGGDGNDTLDGGLNDDVISGDAGADSIRGHHGHDSIDGGTGADTINGGDGNDTINGGDDADLIGGADGNDFINGGMGNDIVTGGDGNDTVFGGSGNDVLLGDEGDDTVNGQGGTDLISGGQGVDTLVGLMTEINEAFTLSNDLLKRLELL